MNKKSRIKQDKFFQIDFFHDFIKFLKYVEKNSIKTTQKGNISLRDINNLTKIFRPNEFVKDHNKYGWRIWTEESFEYFHQIRILCEVMQLIYKRKRKFLVSKKGIEFLKKTNTEVQYKDMVINYWQKVNWDYFFAPLDNGETTLNEILQYYQDNIWSALLEKNSEWIHINDFSKALIRSLGLEALMDVSEEDDVMVGYEIDIDEIIGDRIYYSLFYRNLERFGCVVIKQKKGKYGFKRPHKFRSTPTGLAVYDWALKSD